LIGFNDAGMLFRMFEINISDNLLVINTIFQLYQSTERLKT